MKLLRKFQELLDINNDASDLSRAILKQANVHGADAEHKRGLALGRLKTATEQAEARGVHSGRPGIRGKDAMKIFTSLRELRNINTAAAESSRAILEQANRHGADAERKQGRALAQLEQATAQAARLSAADARNHYSESLTQSFRGSHA